MSANGVHPTTPPVPSPPIDITDMPPSSQSLAGTPFAARFAYNHALVADLGLILGEAAATARERGVDVLADRAERLLAGAGA